MDQGFLFPDGTQKGRPGPPGQPRDIDNLQGGGGNLAGMVKGRQEI